MTYTSSLDAGRERALLGKVGEQAGEELADYTQSVYRTILAAGRSYQNACSGVTSKVYETIRKALDTTPDLFPQRATVACQGVEGAYSQIACDSIFKAPTILYFNVLERRLECQRVDDRGKHAHLVALHPVEAALGAAQAAEDVSAADDDSDLHA